MTKHGFSEESISFYMIAGIHFTEDGRKELRAFPSRIEAMKQNFLSEHPDLPLRYFNDLDSRLLPMLKYPGRIDGHSIDEAIAFVNKEWRRS